MWARQTSDPNYYVVSGNTVYRIFGLNGTATPIGTVSGNGPVSIADNGTQLFFACNPIGYIYNDQTNVFQQITDPDFPGASTVGYIDGYFTFTQPNSQKIWVTALLNGTSIDPLDFASAEAAPDNLVAVYIDHKEIWLFGTNSTEVWYDAGNPAFPFEPIQGAFNELGCVAPFSLAKLDNTIFWLGQDARGRGIVYKAKGYIGERVSTHAVEWQIQQYADLKSAVAFSYQEDGHSFYVLNFPSANVSWVYDVSTGVWHERASWDTATSDWSRYPPAYQCNFNGAILVGDYSNNNIYVLDQNVFDYNGGPRRWYRTWRALPTGQNNLKRTAQHSLQLDCETGVGLTGYSYDEAYVPLGTSAGDTLVTSSGDTIVVTAGMIVQGANPEAMLRWSDDGGHTWSNIRTVSMGRIGQYGRRAIWRRLGMTQKIRDRVYEVSGSDPVKIAIVGAELILDPTNA